MNIVKNLDESKLVQIPGLKEFIDKSDYHNIYMKHKSDWVKKEVKIQQGYYAVTVNTLDGKVRRMNLHRIIALAFIPNPNNYKNVIFKDGNHENLNLDNLEWVNYSQRTINSYKIGIQSQKKGKDNNRSKSVAMYDLFTGLKLKVFGSINEAARETGYSVQLISQHCTKELFPRSKVHYFRFEE